MAGWRWADDPYEIKRTYRRDSRGRFAGGGGGGGKRSGGKRGGARSFANRKQRNKDGSLNRRERERLEAELRYLRDPYRARSSYNTQRAAEIERTLAGKTLALELDILELESTV